MCVEASLLAGVVVGQRSIQIERAVNRDFLRFREAKQSRVEPNRHSRKVLAVVR
jgi:hypothetical protein